MTTVRIGDPLVGWQEIDEADQADEHELLAELLRPGGHVKDAERRTLERSFARGYEHVGFGTATPISVPPGLTVRRQKVTQTCSGRRKVTPHRVCVQALIDIPVLADWPGFVDLNGHLPRQAPDLWRVAHQNWCEVTDDWNMGGWTILTQRDTNWHQPMPKLDALERPLLKAGVDRITTVRGRLSRGLNVELLDKRTVQLSIDGHDAHGVKLKLTNPATWDELILWVVTANIGRGVRQAEARANIALVRRRFRLAA